MRSATCRPPVPTLSECRTRRKPMPTASFHEARGKAAQIIQAAEAYRTQTVVEAKGQAARFIKVYDEYAKAPEVTRRRLHIEAMARLFEGKDKIIVDADAGG